MVPQGPTSWLDFVLTVRVICQIYDGSVTSLGRTDERNLAVGGHSNSRHRWARNASAIDVVFDSPEGFDKAAAAAQKCGLKVVKYVERLQLHLASTGEWVPD